VRKRYQKEFLTRRAIIQAVYSNLSYFDNDLINTVLQNDHILSEVEIDKHLLSSVLEKVLENWEDFFIKEEFVLSRCAQAIMRCAVAEFQLSETHKNIIFNEYIEFSKMFCENETKLINKLLENKLNPEVA
jgi:transcription termination factor NusB